MASPNTSFGSFAGKQATSDGVPRTKLSINDTLRPRCLLLVISTLTIGRVDVYLRVWFTSHRSNISKRWPRLLAPTRNHLFVGDETVLVQVEAAKLHKFGIAELEHGKPTVVVVIGLVELGRDLITAKADLAAAMSVVGA